MTKTNPQVPNSADARRHCVVLLSGGVDSAACVDFYLAQRFLVSGLYVSHGQPGANREKHAAQAVSGFYGIPLSVIEMAGCRPKSDGEIMGRNAMLLFAALMEAEESNGLIALGIHSGTRYWDCSPSFVHGAQAIVDGYCDGRIRVAAPFIEWTKQDVWEYCVQRRVPVDLTYSCERGLDQPCGCCLSCQDLEALGVCQKLHNPA